MKPILAALAVLVTGALAAGPAFPLKVADSGRYLTDAKGAPFLYHADTGWRLFTDLTTEEALHYLDDRRAKGFTAIQSQLVVHRGEGKAVTREGVATFLDPKNEDIAQPNPAYFAHAEKLVEQAADRGLLMAMSSLEACRWHELVPDEKSEIVTAGRGLFGSTDFVTVAATRDGRLALAYLPTPSTITVNLSKFSGPVRATWFDPVNGARNIGPEVFKNSGERKFSHAMKNAGGDSDWVLVLETEKEKP